MKRQRRARVRPECTDHDGLRERLEMLKQAVSVEIGQIHKTNALLIATQFAANHGCEWPAAPTGRPGSRSSDTPKTAFEVSICFVVILWVE